MFYPLQVPYETLNKRFRAAQKNIDRETSHVTMVVAELEKTLSSSFPVVDSVVSLLDGVVEKLSALKRKVSSNVINPSSKMLMDCNKGPVTVSGFTVSLYHHDSFEFPS